MKPLLIKQIAEGRLDILEENFRRIERYFKDNNIPSNKLLIKQLDDTDVLQENFMFIADTLGINLLIKQLDSSGSIIKNLQENFRRIEKKTKE